MARTTRTRNGTNGLPYIAEPLRKLAVPVDSLHEDPANARQHDERNVEAIKASLVRFGQRSPIVVQKQGMVVRAGNGRLRAAKALGWEHIAAVVVDENSVDATAFAIADNRTAELASWDDDVLGALLAQLQAEDFPVIDLGFDEKDLADLLADPVGEVTEDEVPPVPEEATSQRGQLWQLGRHRVLCGDSATEEDVVRLLGGAKASCVFTDPPYGVSVGAKNKLLDGIDRASKTRRVEADDIEDDALSPEDLKQRLVPAFTNLRKIAMADDCSLFVTAPQGGELGMMMMMMREAGLPVRHVLIWKKNAPTFSMGRLDYDYAHEPILLTWGKRHKRPMRGQHKTSVWEVDKPRASPEHPTMKPVELYANAYLNNSEDGDSVADIYAGSGTAFIAAEQINRTCYGIEIEPRYVDVIINRWENLTGDKATLVTA